MLDDKIGNPLVKGATVSGKVLKQGKGKKITIYTYKQKGNSNRKKQGHRQPYTKLVIKDIKKTARKAAPKSETAEAAEHPACRLQRKKSRNSDCASRSRSRC